MCYLRLTYYACAHTSPIHPLGYQRPSPAKDARQANPEIEWPTHADTGVEGCQDACRRGARCGYQLEELETISKSVTSVCENCKLKDV